MCVCVCVCVFEAETLNEDEPDKELLWNLQLLSEVRSCSLPSSFTVAKHLMTSVKVSGFFAVFRITPQVVRLLVNPSVLGC